MKNNSTSQNYWDDNVHTTQDQYLPHINAQFITDSLPLLFKWLHEKYANSIMIKIQTSVNYSLSILELGYIRKRIIIPKVFFNLVKWVSLHSFWWSDFGRRFCCVCFIYVFVCVCVCFALCPLSFPHLNLILITPLDFSLNITLMLIHICTHTYMCAHMYVCV